MASLLGEPNQRDAGATDLAVATTPLRKLLLAGDHVAEARAHLGTGFRPGIDRAGQRARITAAGADLVTNDVETVISEFGLNEQMSERNAW